MKYTNISAFEKHLEGSSPDHFADIYLILAKDEFPRKNAVDILTKILLPDSASHQLSLLVYDAQKQSVGLIFEELETMSFFSKKRVIIVQNVDSFDKSSCSRFENYFTSSNHSVCLVLVAETVNRATNFYKKGEKAGVVLDIPEEKPWEKEKTIAEWLRSEVSRFGKQITPMTCQMIVKQLGIDQSMLQGELQKLISFVGDSPAINEKDVSSVCTIMNHENAWQLGEAIFRRDPSTALRISKALLNDGVALIALLRQIRTQFQTEYQVCSIMVSGGSSGDVSKEFPYMRGIILDRHISQAQSYGMKRLKAGLLAIDKAELQSKSSSIDPEFLADILMIQLTKE